MENLKLQAQEAFNAAEEAFRDFIDNAVDENAVDFAIKEREQMRWNSAGYYVQDGEEHTDSEWSECIEICNKYENMYSGKKE